MILEEKKGFITIFNKNNNPIKSPTIWGWSHFLKLNTSFKNKVSQWGYAEENMKSPKNAFQQESQHSALCKNQDGTRMQLPPENYSTHATVLFSNVFLFEKFTVLSTLISDISPKWIHFMLKL